MVLIAKTAPQIATRATAQVVTVLSAIVPTRSKMMESVAVNTVGTLLVTPVSKQPSLARMAITTTERIIVSLAEQIVYCAKIIVVVVQSVMEI
jgi:hypothetical protein